MAKDRKKSKEEPFLEDNSAVSSVKKFVRKTLSIKEKPISEQTNLSLNFEQDISKAKISTVKKGASVPTVTLNFNSNYPIYYQIHSENIYNIFSSGLITPRIYEAQLGFPDVQAINSSFLVLSNGYISRNDEKTILLEIALKREEIEKLRVCEGIAAFDRPLPISRIKTIVVDNQLVKQEISNTALSGDGGLIPDRLIVIKDSSLNSFNLSFVPENLTIEHVQTNNFDRILGTFAFLSNYSVLTASRTNVIKTLPDHFHIAAKIINKDYQFEIGNSERVSGFYKVLFKDNKEDQPPLQWLVSRMSDGSNFTDTDVLKFAELLLKTSKTTEFMDEARVYFSALTKSMERKRAIREIPTLNHNDKFYLYLFAILRQYGNLSSEDKSIVRADLPNIIFPTYGEYTFAILGYFYGYRALRNFEDRILVEDKVFSNVFNREKRLPLKFRLNTEFDLSLVESVYQYAFNGNRSTEKIDFSRYSYISTEQIRKPQYMGSEYTFDANLIQGKAIYSLRKKTLIDQLEQILQNTEFIPIISEIGLLCYRSKVPWMGSDLKNIYEGTAKIPYYIQFRKQDVINAVKIGQLNAIDALNSIRMSIQFKEF